eukprot:938696-Rhodomonas_salina.1
MTPSHGLGLEIGDPASPCDVWWCYARLEPETEPQMIICHPGPAGPQAHSTSTEKYYNCSTSSSTRARRAAAAAGPTPSISEAWSRYSESHWRPRRPAAGLLVVVSTTTRLRLRRKKILHLEPRVTVGVTVGILWMQRRATTVPSDH